MVVRAHAKVNLALAVGPADASGFHPIASWMASIDLADEFEVTQLPDGEKSEYVIEWARDAARATAIDWPIEKDLAVRAHRLLEERAGRVLPVRMVMRKRTPVGGGLGGGSSDGAAMLRAVDALFALRTPHVKLVALSARLGSDVGFFLDEARAVGEAARPALVTGLGQNVRRVERVAGWLALVLPPFGCATGAVYRAFDGLAPGALRAEEVERVIGAAVRSGMVESGDLFNDLAAAAERVEPRLAALRQQVAREIGRTVHVTGSGSTMFVVAAGADEARAVARRVEAMGLGVRALAAELV